MRIACFCVVALLVATGASAQAASSQNPQTPTSPSVQTPPSATIQPEAPVVQELDAQDSEVRLSAGDLIEVTVFGMPEMTQQARVNGRGEVSLALVGNIKVDGLTSEQARDAIAKRYAESGVLNNPNIAVIIKEYATSGITVLGEVQRPGIYPLLGARRLFDALSAAGGLTQRAGREITITHRNRPNTPIRVAVDADPNKAMDNNVLVMPGDTVVVSRAGVVYVAGEVVRPGGYVLENNGRLTVLQAMALAQGTSKTANLKQTRVVRTTDKGPVEIPVPLKEIMSSKSPDMELFAGDILFIPSSTGKRAARRGMEAIIQVATGLAIYAPR